MQELEIHTHTKKTKIKIGRFYLDQYSEYFLEIKAPWIFVFLDWFTWFSKHSLCNIKINCVEFEYMNIYPHCVEWQQKSSGRQKKPHLHGDRGMSTVRTDITLALQSTESGVLMSQNECSWQILSKQACSIFRGAKFQSTHEKHSHLEGERWQQPVVLKLKSFAQA